MRILIITMNVGKTAPGIVFEKLIQGLSASNDVDLLVADYQPSTKLSDVKNIIISKNFNIHPRISMLLITLFFVNPFDFLWTWKSKRKLSRLINNKYDVIISFLASGNYASTIAGTFLSKKYQCKLAVHTTDAIPAPIGWIDKDLFYRSLKKMMARYLCKVDAFFSTNPHMLNYQLDTFKHKNNLITNVIYNPGLDRNQIFSVAEGPVNNFVYTGGLYGVRKAEYFLTAFEKLLKVYPDSKILFVGSDKAMLPLSKFRPETLQNIEFVSYTKDLDAYYRCATALIDIDADIDHDVFISSKMPNYLMINRIIISETGKNSPSRNLFKGIDSIIQCDHDAEQIFNAMISAIHMKSDISFNDRIEVIKLFQLPNIVNNLNTSLNQMIA